MAKRKKKNSNKSTSNKNSSGLQFVSYDEYNKNKNFVSYDVYQQNKKKREEDELKRKEQERNLQRNFDEQFSGARTKYWQNKTKETTYTDNGDQSWQSYAAKMIYDTPGALEKEQERQKKEEEKQAQQQTKAWKDLTKETTYDNSGVNAYAIKQINDTPVKQQDVYKYGTETKAKQAKLNDYLKSISKKNVLSGNYSKEKEKEYKRATDVYAGAADLGSWASGRTQDVEEALSAKNAKNIRQSAEELRKTGYFDQGSDVNMWSPEKRTQIRESSVKQAEELQKQIDELNRKISEQSNTGNRWDPLLDLYTSDEVEKLRDILYDRDFSEEERNNGYGHSRAEKQQAQEKLNQILNKNNGIGSQSISASAQNFYKYNQQNLNEYRDHMNMDSMRRMAYDSVNGYGAYEKLLAGMQPNEKEELIAKIDRALDFVTDPNGELGMDLRTAQAKLEYANDMIKKIDAQNQKDQEYQNLFTDQQNMDTVWHKEKVNKKEQSFWNTAMKAASPDGIKFSEKLERVDGVYAALDPNYKPTGDIVGADYRNALLMNDDERNQFISLYNAGKKAEAWSFYEGLEPYLNQAASYFENLSTKETARRLPILSSIASEVANIAQPLEAIMNLPDQIVGALGVENAATDPYSERYIMTRLKNGIRSQVTSDLGDWGWVYQGAMSGVDSFMNIALAQGMGLTDKVITIAGKQIPALQAATLALFHTQAFETSLQNTMTQGNDSFGYDFIEAWIDAAIETATEIWSVENWIADPKNLLTYVGKIAISEPSEEIVGAIVEPYVKEMLGHQNQYKERAKQILADGGYEDGNGQWVEVKDMDAATRQAMREWNHDIRMAAQEALISVGPSIGMGSIKLANQNVNIGREMNPYREESTTRRIAEAAAGMEEGTDSQKGAKKILDMLDQGKKVGNYRMGQLAQDVLRESGEKTAETIKQTRTEQIAKYLQDNNVSAEEAANLAETIEKAIEKGGIENLSKKERQAIHDSQAATNALYRFGMTQGEHIDTETQKTLAEEVKNRTQAETKTVNSISDLLTKNAERKLVLHEATPDEISEAKGERIQGNREVIVYDRKTGQGQFAKIEGVEVNKNRKGWELRLRVSGQEKTLRASDVKLTNYQTAQIINQATNIPELYSEGYTNLLLDAANEGQFTEDMMKDAKKLRLYAYAGFLSDQMPQTNLPQQLAERIWQQGTTEKYRNRKSQVSEYNRKQVGRAVYGKAVFGTQEWTEAVKDLDKDTVEWMETVAAVAQRAGIEVSFRNMTEDDKTWGWENKAGIGLNIAGMNYVRDAETGKVVPTGQKHHMLVTFGHEFTHWLQRNSLQGYNRLEKFVLQNYINDYGYEQFEQKVNYRMYHMGESLDEAMAEIVAESCDQILMDKQVQERIAQTDSKLFSEIKVFVKNLVERFKKAIKGMPQDSASQYSKDMARHINEIRKLWLGAYDEALSGMITEENGNKLTPEEYQQMVAEETTEHTRNSRAYSYDNLISKPDMELTQLKDITEEEVSEAQRQTTRDFAKGIVNAIKARNHGKANILNIDTGKEIQINVDSIKHSIGRDLTKTYIQISRQLDSIVKNAIAVNELNTRDQNKYNYSTMFVGMAETEDEYIAVRLNVENKTWRANDYEILYSVTKDSIEKGGTRHNDALLKRAGTPSTMSIKNIMEIVKNSDNITAVLSKDAADKLEIERPYKKDLSEHLRYSRAQLDNEYMEAVESGDMEAAQRMVDEAADKAGYSIEAYHGTAAPFTTFDRSKLGEATGAASASVGFYLTDSKQVAESFSRISRDPMKKMLGFADKSATIMNLRAKFTNPYIYETDNGDSFDLFRKDLFEQAKEYTKYWAFPTTTIEQYKNMPPARLNEVGKSFAQKMKKQGYDGIIIRQTIMDGRIPHDFFIAFDSEQIKSADPIVYDDNGNVIPLSERFNDQKTDIRWSRAQLDNEYMAAVENGNTQRQQELVYEAGDRAGYSIRAFHGTARGDRVGTEFKPERATSGPMAFFTDDRGIAENYAKDKNDTSIAYDEEYGDYYNQYRTIIKGKSVPIGNLWNTLSYTKRQKMLEDARHITWDDEVENIIYDKNAKTSNGGLQDYLLREKKGNVIDAMVYAWLESGDLYNKEEMFLDVLKLMGIDNVKWNNPDERHEKVYDVLLNIQNPFVVNEMYTNEFVDDLEAWWEEQDQDAYIKETYNTDLWDKNNRTVEEWADIARENIANNLTTAWTSIPDAVSDYLRSRGYDGIKDEGGKGGGRSHTVWIPFRSEQIKSAEPVTYDNQGKVIPLSERFNEQKKDIRWSRAQTENDSRQQELFDAVQKARDIVNVLREQDRKIKPEMDAWVDRLTKAQDNGTLDEAMAEYNEWEKGFTKQRNELYEAEQKYKDANRAYDDYIEERDVAEERKKIEASGMSEADYRRKQAADEFGFTTDFREAGYLLPNGKMLNFSGEKGKHYGSRGQDHRGISTIYASREKKGGAAMFAFMKDGNIRVMAETPGIDLITTIEPTAEQYEQIRNMARRFAGEHFFNVDLTDEHGYTDDSIEYDGRVDPNKVVNDIKSYYKTGVVPTQSTVSQFHYSRWTDSGMDVNLWMKNATPSTVMTEDERVLLQAYNDMRIKMDLSLRKQMDYKAKIRQLEGKDNLTPAQKDELTATKNRLKIEQDKYARMEDEMFQVTNGEGFAAVMYRENMKLKDYIQGKTQDQVKQAIDEMLKLVNRTQEQLTKDTEDLKKLATHQAVQAMKSFMGKTSLGRMAGILRKTYNSNMNKTEIEDRLAEMALKKASGQDITADTEALAQDLLDKMRGIRTDTLESLRGQTLVIGQSLAEELKKENSSIKELQSRIKGSGVKIQTGVKSSTGEIDKHSRISEQWKELREKNGALPDVENMAEIDKLHTIVDFIESELRASTGAEQFNIDFDEVAAMVRASVGNVTTYLVDDPTARAQINNLMKQIADLSKATEKTAADMQQLYQQMDDVVLAGQKAKGWATILQRDVTDAIKYYNTTARVAAEKERTKVRKALIEQLRSETAQKLVAQQEKFREQMANDKKARELQQDNEALRSKISTVSTRMANRIFAETDQKNVPEETKGLVRQVLNMISQHDGFFRKVTYWDKQQVDNVRQRLTKMISNYGAFDPDTDLDWLVVKTADPRDNDYTARDKVEQDLVDIETGLMEYRNAEGQGRISLADRKAALEKVQNALSEIWNVIKARSEMEIAGRKWQVIELAEWMRGEMENSRFKGERKGFGSRARNTVSGAVTWGNLTPEYFFKNLKNRAMDQLHKGLKIAEDRSGLEAAKAKERLAQIAQEDGFASWDGQEEHKVQTRSGEITMTTEQIMALYATWLRESSQMRPEDTAHLLNGGFVLAEKENNKGLPGREKRSTRPIRMSKDQLNALNRHLSQEQTKYVHDMVAYMSGELAELGNEASMKMYGIKKFTEQFYYPIRSWGGVLNKRSDAGIASNNENRAAQQGFSKRVKNNASNAIEIGDFTPTAIKHVAGMITYNTVGPAIENLNKVLNQQLQYGEVKYTPDGAEEDLDDTYKLNMRAAFENAYGKQAADYLAKFMKDMNGGVTTERNAFDKLLSIFKKNAVAGSLSVAAQQPLSYIRAAMMINPKYLAAAISPQYWKGSFAEMMKHSGVAVIKQMGKFDMNFGQTMQEWITPEGMESKARKAWNKTTDVITGLPGAMDAMTWTRMWTAVKLEQMAENKDMDYSSDEFMAKVAERFNELMRRTQVYDSVMTKSQNMRSNHFYAKTLTSFMAEPTLTLNVLADAMQNIKEKGGKMKAVKAVATFLLSAAAQAGAKAFFGAGRTPDKKKNREENFMNKFWYNLLSEANPLGLIPGYRQIIETLNEGELKDDTMSMVAKGGEVLENIWKLATEWNFSYRNIEDSIGQFLQLATDIPAKNLMRDFRAMVNWFSNGTAEGFTGNSYAQRETSKAVLKNQFIETLLSNDLGKLINEKLGDAGYKMTNDAYYQRIVDAEKAGNQEAADQLKEFIILKGKAKDPEGEMNEKIRGLYKVDEDLSAEERLAKQKEYGMKAGGSFVKEEYKKGNLTRKEAEKLYRQENPKASDKDVLEAFDKIDWEKNGKDPEGYTNYTPLYEAIGNNKSDEIRAAVDHMLKNGYTKDEIKKQMTTKYKQAYLDAKGSEKTRLMDALTKTYKAIGLTAEEALKIINGWKPKKQ